MNPDLIYGTFCVGAFLITLHSVHKAWKSKKAGGISVWFPLYFAMWGFANMFVFGLNEHPVSFIANLASMFLNLFYVYVIHRNEQLEKFSER